MHIANPIYDVVFKYLMEDIDIAKLIISTIIGEEIIDLDFKPQENAVFIDKPFSLTIHRLDFSAIIKQADGTQKQVLIEIQKAKFPTDILRFRRYLGQQYQNKNNVYTVQVNGGRTEQRHPHIIVIYFLGYPLEKVTAPVLKIGRHCQDLTTGEPINTIEPFVEQVTHDGYVIQIPHLRKERRTEVEQLLTVFDQRWVTAEDGRVLSIRETDYPEPYRRIIRRLQQAIVDEEVRQSMQAEDEVLEGFAIIERDMAAQQDIIHKQQQALTDKDKALAEQQQMITEQQQALTEQQRALAEQQKLVESLQQRLQRLENS